MSKPDRDEEESNMTKTKLSIQENEAAEEMAKKIERYVEQYDYVTFAELSNRIPGFNAPADALACEFKLGSVMFWTNMTTLASQALEKLFVERRRRQAWVSRIPVTAWRIDKDVALPVTPDLDMNPNSNCIGWAVLLPDGRVIQPYVGRFTDEEARRMEMAKDAESERKLRKVKAAALAKSTI
jgi:hypothetical protein